MGNKKRSTQACLLENDSAERFCQLHLQFLEVLMGIEQNLKILSTWVALEVGLVLQDHAFDLPELQIGQAGFYLLPVEVFTGGKGAVVELLPTWADLMARLHD